MDNSINVMHIISSPSAGGAEVYVRDLVISSSKNSITPSIVFISSSQEVGRESDFENKYKKLLDKENIKYITLPHGSRRNLFKGIIVFRAFVKDFKPNVIHAHLLIGIIYSKLLMKKIPIIYTHHSTIISTNKFLFKFLLRWSNGVISISHQCDNYLKKFVNKKVRKATILNAIDLSRITPKKVKDENVHIRLLAVGSIYPAKNYPLMIDAFCKAKAMSKFPLLLYIAGEGDNELKSRLVKKINLLKLKDSVTLLGNRSDVPNLMREAEIFLMSSSWEGLPIALIEAQSSGLPAIVTDVGGCSEVIDLTAGGEVVPPNDADELANSIVKISNDFSLRKMYSENANKNSELFGIDRALQEHLEFYKLFYWII